jgi:hypothetical protein
MVVLEFVSVKAGVNPAGTLVIFTLSYSLYLFSFCFQSHFFLVTAFFFILLEGMATLFFTVGLDIFLFNRLYNFLMNFRNKNIKESFSITSLVVLESPPKRK